MGKQILQLELTNLSFLVTEEELKEAFSKCDNLTDIKIHKNSDGLSKGRGTIKFSKISSAKQALDTVNNLKLKGRQVKGNLFVIQKPHPPKSTSTANLNAQNLPPPMLRPSPPPQNQSRISPPPLPSQQRFPRERSRSPLYQMIDDRVRGDSPRRRERDYRDPYRREIDDRDFRDRDDRLRPSRDRDDDRDRRHDRR